jgi:hypothetical protein
MTLRAKMLIRALAVLLVIGLTPYTAAGSASAAPYCGIRWGSLTKSNLVTADTLPEGTLRNVRAGRHACFDRLVIDLARDTAAWWVQYVDPSDPTFNYVRQRGGAALAIIVEATDLVRSTYRPANFRNLVNVTGFRTFRQASIVVFESRREDADETYPAYIMIGLGVRARLPYRVFYLDDGATRGRLVIDVAHRW